MESLVQLDQELTLWLNQHNPEVLNGFWGFLSSIPVWIPLYIFIGGFGIWRLGWKKGLLLIAACLLGLLFTDQLANLFKNGFMRLRPCHDAWMQNNGVLCPNGVSGGLYGFFSGHAANTFCYATIVWLGLQLNDQEHNYTPLGIGLYLWAALVSLSRVMLAAHYLGDILVGSLIGLAMGLALSYLLRWVIVKAEL